MKTVASEYYRNRRGNCSQSVAAAWHKKTSLDINLANELSGCGHGKAPEGLCGALYATQCIADKHAAEHIINQFSYFTGGHITCKAIRSAGTLPCSQCVGVAADLLEKHNSICLMKIGEISRENILQHF